MTTSTMVLDRAAERRTKYIQGLRELIALLESNPDLPAPYLFPEATVHTSCETDDEGVAAVARIADRLGVKVATSAGGTHIKAILTLPSGAAYEFLHISHGEMARYSEHMRKYHEDKAAEVADDALVQTAPLDVETAADVDGVAAALLGQDEPNRCPECKLLSAHKPFCSRPVRLPWEGEPGDDGRCVSVHEVYGRCWSYAGHDGQHFVEVGDEGEAAETWTDEPDESEYAVATDMTWLSAVTGDVPGEVVHKTTVYDGGASGWCWGCSCGEGSIELATEELARIEAREHLDEVGTRVFAAKLPVEWPQFDEAPKLIVPTSMLDEDPAPGEHVYVGGEVSNTGCAAECSCGVRVEGHTSLDAAIGALNVHVSISGPKLPAVETGVAGEAKSEHQAYVFPSGRWFGWTCSCQEGAGGYDSWVAAEEALGRHAFESEVQQ